jgi:hypothetical protein
MKSLVETAPHSDVVLVSTEKEEIGAYKGILAVHSPVNFIYLFSINFNLK